MSPLVSHTPFPAHRLFAAAATIVSAVILSAALAPAVCVAAPVVEPYGEVERFGGLANEAAGEAKYGPSTTEGVKPGRFVLPLGMALDQTDTAAGPEGAIYVLENLNPQQYLFRLKEAELETAKMELQYRIQKLGKGGAALGSVEFTLKSSVSEPDLRAIAIAVDGADERVYVLLTDRVAAPGGQYWRPVAARVDVWTTGRTTGKPLSPSVPGLAKMDAMTQASELVGPAVLQTGKAEGEGDISPVNIAPAGLEAGADLAVGGTRYLASEHYSSAIQRIATTGANTGKVVTTWENGAEAANATAQLFGMPLLPNSIYSLSSSGSAFVISLGETVAELSQQEGTYQSDLAPDLAEIPTSLETGKATDVLPWSLMAEDVNGINYPGANFDRIPTMAVHGDERSPENTELAASSGGTAGAGVLGPSVIGLNGDGELFPTGLYAGIVGHWEGEDVENPASKAQPFSWRLATFETTPSGEEKIKEPATLAVRVFDGQGHSLGMAGSVTAGACNLAGGPARKAFWDRGSFVALVPGRDGAFFALVQPDLNQRNAPEGTVGPGEPVGGGGDEIVEFAPGAGTPCPQPKAEGITVTNETTHGTPQGGTGPVTVPVGTALSFEAGKLELQGGAPWAYEWDLEGGAAAGLATNTFHFERGGRWLWPEPTVKHTYGTAGSFTVKLALANDFGTLPLERQVNVVAPGELQACFRAVQNVPAGQPVELDGSCTSVPQFDSITAYRWQFGDGTPAETRSIPTEQHVYEHAGEYAVKLTIIDALGREASIEQTVTIAPPVVAPGGGGGGGGTTGPGGGGAVAKVLPRVEDTSPTSVAPRVASVASSRGAVELMLSCPANKPSCTGSVTLKGTIAGSGHGKHHRHAKAVSFGKASFSLAGGATSTISVPLSPAALALLRKAHILKLTATILATDPGGHASTVTETATVHAPTAHHNTKKHHH